MTVSKKSARRLAATGLVVSATALAAHGGARFWEFTPLALSAGPTADESRPITFGSADIEQRSIADRTSVLAENTPNSGSWDMNTLNETGPERGRFLFTVFETGQSGVQRHDLWNGTTDTIWQSPVAAPNPLGHVAFDAAYWTP